MTVNLAVVDYGMGNRRSVEKALLHVGAIATVTSDHDQILAADGLIVPGVGAFPLAIERLRESGLADLILRRLRGGVPVLGICLGMQIGFDSSEEMGGADGLGIISGEVKELEAPGLKLPHIGWSLVHWRQSSELIEGLPYPCAFYHVHSFAAMPRDASNVLGVAEYGESFVTAVVRDSFYGVQFHPEKSSVHGLHLLANFASICARAKLSSPTSA